MTTAVAPRRQQGVAISPPPDVSRPVTLPAIVTETSDVEAFGRTRRWWRMRALEAGETVELQNVLLQLESGFRPCDSTRVKWHIGKLLNHWDDRKSDAEKDQIIVDWCDDLGEFSETHIAQACRDWRRTQQYRPRIAEIVAMCERLFQRDIESRRRIRVLLGLDKPRFWEALPKPPEPMVQRDPSAMQDMLKGLTRKLLAPSAANRDPVDLGKIKETLESRNPDAVSELAQMRGKGTT